MRRMRRAGEALAIIGEAGVTRAVFHWHKSDEQTTRAIINAGYFISLTPEVAYRERDQDLARMLPSNRILVETDGPWPYGGQFAGRLTEPAMIKDVVAAIAHLRCTTFEEIAAGDDGQRARAVSNQRVDRFYAFTGIGELIIREICVGSGYNIVAMRYTSIAERSAAGGEVEIREICVSSGYNTSICRSTNIVARSADGSPAS